MKDFFYKLSFQSKICSLVSFITFVGLFFLYIFFAQTIVDSYKNNLISKTNTSLKVIGSNSVVAIEFNNKKEVNKILSSLSSISEIKYTAIFDKNDILFAEFVNDKNKYQNPEQLKNNDIFFDKNFLYTKQDIKYKNEIFGNIFAVASIDGLNKQINEFFLYTVLILLIIFSLIIFSATKLSKILTKPILELANVATKISSEADYSIKISTDNKDEIKILYDNFNKMLSEIYKRDLTIREFNKQLEKKVEKRTDELKISNTKLQEDIKKRNLIEKELRESKRKNDAILKAIPDMMFVCSEDGVFIDYKTKDPTIMFVNSNKIIGSNLKDILPKEIAEKTLFFIKKSLSTESIQIFEYELSINNNLKYFESRIVVCDEKKVLSIVRDISNRHKTEAELLKAKKLESLGLLAGGIAHDFNNILQAVLGNTQYIKNSGIVFDELISSCFDDIEEATMLAKDLTYQLLTFSKGGTPIRKTASVSEMIQDSAIFSLRGSNVNCEFHISENLRNVYIDKGQINRVLNNLVINADQAMPNGGTLEISAINVKIEKEESLILSTGNYIKISIKDNGIGIPAEYINQIFDPYFTTKQKGSGLGLATCYSIIKKHDGLITVDTELGVQTTFNVFLPASENNVDKTIDKSKPLKGVGRILVMDDDNLIKEFASRMLEHLGYDSVLASDGEEAIEIFKRNQEDENPFQAVILDLTVPGGMGGEETIKELLKLDPNVNAIVASGYVDSPILAKPSEYGFKGIVTKPYSIEAISELLSNLTKPSY